MDRNTMIELGYLPANSNPNKMELKIYNTENSLRKKLTTPSVCVYRSGLICLNATLVDLLKVQKGSRLILAQKGADWYIACSKSPDAFILRTTGENLGVNCVKVAKLLMNASKAKSDAKSCRLHVVENSITESGYDLHLIILSPIGV